MKRERLVRELEQAGCRLLRHGGKHDVFLNPANGRKAPLPRHREISDGLCRLADDGNDTRTQVWQNDSQRCASPRFEVGIGAPASFIQPPRLDIRLDAAVPRIREMLFEPSSKGVQFIGGQLADGGFEFLEARAIFSNEGDASIIARSRGKPARQIENPKSKIQNQIM